MPKASELTPVERAGNLQKRLRVLDKEKLAALENPKKFIEELFALKRGRSKRDAGADIRKLAEIPENDADLLLVSDDAGAGGGASNAE